MYVNVRWFHALLGLLLSKGYNISQIIEVPADTLLANSQMQKSCTQMQKVCIVSQRLPEVLCTLGTSHTNTYTHKSMMLLTQLVNSRSLVTHTDF